MTLSCSCDRPARHRVGGRYFSASPHLGQHPPLQQHLYRVRLHTHSITCFVDQCIECAGICDPQPAAPARHSIQDALASTGRHPTHVKGPQLVHSRLLYQVELQMILLAPQNAALIQNLSKSNKRLK